MIILRSRKLYFVSPNPDLWKEIIEPQIPKNFLTRREIIDNKLPRIQLFRNVSDAISGKYLDETPEKKLTVYEAIGLRKENLVKPEMQDVPYGHLLEEWWYLVTMRARKVVDIELSGKILKTKDYHYGPRQTTAKLKFWEWKEILKPWEKSRLPG